MEIAISVPGRFHLFDLAKQLLKRDMLSQLITSYPKFEVVKYGIPRDKITSILIKEVIQRGWGKIPILRSCYNPQFFIHETFDKLASRKLRRCDIFVGGSSVSLHTIKTARRFNSLVVLEHGSSHIEYQRDILREEYEKYGIDTKTPFTLPHPRIVEKELKEYEEADYICMPSTFTKKTFLDKGISEKKIIQVPFGVDLSQFKQVPKTDNVFRVVFVGGMSLRKGVHYLMQAFSELRLPNSELLLIGSMNNQMKTFFKKYRGSYNFIGHVSQSELYKYYSQGSVFVLASIEEGLGMVQLQAMACGLPVIATTNTGAEDIICDGKDGFVIPIRDVETLKEKLVYLYENPDKREEMSQSAKEKVSSRFTWDDYGEKIILEYRRILKENDRKN